MQAFVYTWKTALPVWLLLVVVALLANLSTVLYLTELWAFDHPGNYTHGYLVLAISIWLIAQQRSRLQKMTPCISLQAIWLVAAVAILDLSALLVDVQVVQTIALWLMVIAVTVFALGWQVTRPLLFALLFVAYALPVWYPLSPWLQQVTADASFWLIRLLDVPALLEGQIIVLPAGRMSVEAACAGLNYLLAALTLGTLYGYLNYSRWRSRLLIVLVAALAAVVSNIVRVTIVVYLGHVSAMQHPMVEDHLSLGWMLFAVVMVVLLLLDNRLRHSKPVDNERMEAPVQTSCKPGYRSIFAIVMVLALLLLPLTVSRYSPSGVAAAMQLQLPPQMGSWQAVAAVDSWRPEYPGAISASRVYQRGNDRVTLYSGYYPAQRQGQELINDLNRISNDTVWRKLNPQPAEYAMNGVVVLEQILQNHRGDQRRVWYWYEVAGKRTTSRYMAKLLQLPAMLYARQTTRVVAIADWPNTDAGASRRRLQHFMEELALPPQLAVVPDKGSAE